MNEDFCSYELSKALKACGFDEPCHYHYDCDRGSHIIEPNYTTNDGEGCQYITADDLLEDNNGWQYCSAPTLAHAQKWLREKHHISIRVSYIVFHKVWFADWLNLDSREFDDTDATFATYEEALSDGIAAALELIKKGE